jgi:flagellar basal-body rod modification protein FlgD
MATTDGVQVSTATGANGQQYTQAISNDRLTNEDFLKLMLEQMKQQDPTKPQDSQNMLNQQMQMSSIQTNLDMSNSMKDLQATFKQSALSNASNVIGKIVETDELASDGIRKAYQVGAVESINGEIYVTANEIIGKDENNNLIISTEPTTVPYNKITKINYTALSAPKTTSDSTDTTGSDTTADTTGSDTTGTDTTADATGSDTTTDTTANS